MSSETAAVLADIAAERERQKNVEGWTDHHDNQHKDGETAIAAGMYAIHTAAVSPGVVETLLKRVWPWDWKWWKPKDAERDLVRAGALIVAELERLRRAKKAKGETTS